MPIEPEESKRLNVKMGHCILKIDFDLFCSLISICYERINLDFEELDIEAMILRSPKSLDEMINLEHEVRIEEDEDIESLLFL